MTKKRKKRRREFSERDKAATLFVQNNYCKICGRTLEFPEYDHTDGNPSNNHIINCQALCPNCHVRKTRKKEHCSFDLDNDIFRELGEAFEKSGLEF